MVLAFKRDTNCNPRAVSIPAVVQVISITGVCDVNIVGLVPVRTPVFGIWIHHTEPKASVLEARISANHHVGLVVDPERVTLAIVAAVIVVRNAVAVVAAALFPVAVI